MRLTYSSTIQAAGFVDIHSDLQPTYTQAPTSLAPSFQAIQTITEEQFRCNRLSEYRPTISIYQSFSSVAKGSLHFCVPHGRSWWRLFEAQSYKVPKGVQNLQEETIPLNLLESGNTYSNSIREDGILQRHFSSTTGSGGMCREKAPSYVYNASKAAMNHSTKTLSLEYAKHGIRANAIALGIFVIEMTEMSEHSMQVFTMSENGKAYLGQAHTLKGEVNVLGNMSWQAIPATRAGTAEDMSGAVLYLASRAGAFMSGCISLSYGDMIRSFKSLLDTKMVFDR